VRSKGQVPPAAWESLVVTGKARAAIRRATRAAVRRQYAGLGRQILERAFERAGRPLSDDKLKAALARLARSTVEDVLASVGRGEMFSGDVVRAVYPDLESDKRPVPEGAKGPGWFDLKHGENLKFKRPSGDDSTSIPISGLGSDLAVRFAPDGGAVPGDRIVGIMSPGEGVTIYPIQSPALAAFDNEPDRWLDVRWDLEDSRKRRFPARIALQSINEPGSLAQITTVIAEHDGNIDAVRMDRPNSDFTDMTVDLTVWDLKHLNAIISELRQKRVISAVERIVA
jgi:GTP pyrophosphokinase